MALRRLSEDEVYRIGLASPLAFADWRNPTAAEFNANETNDPNGLIWKLTCAINQDGSQFDLDDPDFDESLTFCQSAGNQERITENATVVFDTVLSKERWLDADDLTSTDPDTGNTLFNTSTLAQSLLRWRGVEYFAFLSIGKGPDEVFAAGDRVSLIRVATDWGVNNIDTGAKANLNNAFVFRGDIAWNYELTA